MSDVMLHGVLEMPPELWTGDLLDVLQRHGRYMQASERIREDAETIRALSERLARAEAEERERCAKFVENNAVTLWSDGSVTISALDEADDEYPMHKALAAAIRAGKS